MRDALLVFVGAGAGAFVVMLFWIADLDRRAQRYRDMADDIRRLR